MDNGSLINSKFHIFITLLFSSNFKSDFYKKCFVITIWFSIYPITWCWSSKNFRICKQPIHPICSISIGKNLLFAIVITHAVQFFGLFSFVRVLNLCQRNPHSFLKMLGFVLIQLNFVSDYYIILLKCSLHRSNLHYIFQ